MIMSDHIKIEDDKDEPFIYCEICKKKIMGGLVRYKIHRTTSHHLKIERALGNVGLTSSPPIPPEWTDIKQYLMYLNVDEPIIGLSALQQIGTLVTDNGRDVLQYKCQICNVETDLYCTVDHVLGSKHRQKYLEQRWKICLTKARRKIQPELKAMAAELEEQEGWGEPQPLDKSKDAKPKIFQVTRSKISTESEQSCPGTDHYKQSCKTDDTRQRMLNEQDDDLSKDLYKDSKIQKESNQAKFGASYTQDGRHKMFYNDSYSSEAPYEEEDSTKCHYSGRGKEHYFNETYSEEHQDRNFSDIGSSKRKHDFHSNSITKKRHWDQDAMYGSYQRKGASMDAVKMHDNSLNYSTKQLEHLPDMEKTGKRVYRQGQHYLLDEDIPIKKPRTGRISNESLVDMDSYDRSTGAMVAPDTKTGKDVDWGVKRLTPKMENVLDVLNNIQNENMLEANFLNERLCSLVKEFQMNKALEAQQKKQASQSTGTFTDSINKSSNYMEPIKDMLAAARSDSNQGFKQAERYDNGSKLCGLQVKCQFPDTLQESGRYKSDFQGLRQTTAFEDNTRDYLCQMHYEKDYNVLTNTNRSRDFKNGSMNYPMIKNRGSEKMRYEDPDQRFYNSWFHTKESEKALQYPFQTNNKQQYGKFYQDYSRAGTTEQRQNSMTSTHHHSAERITNQECWRQYYKRD